MKKYLPIIIALSMIGIIGYIVINKKNSTEIVNHNDENIISNNIGNFDKVRSCVKTPEFLKQLKIPQPVMIDLSQKQYKGIAFLYGASMEKALHPKVWEQYEHFSTYALDKEGNVFLVPTPFISIKPTTFNLQKNLYKLDTKTGKIEIFMHFDDVHPNPSNPYGLSAIAYDCEDDTLWVSSIDETDYRKQRGTIYHIDIKSKKILRKIEGIDALTLSVIKSKKEKYLLLGAARDNGLYAYNMKLLYADNIKNLKPKKLFELPNDNEHIRKIKLKGYNRLELQTIPFSYTLIAQSGENDRLYYSALWDNIIKKWLLKFKD